MSTCVDGIFPGGPRPRDPPARPCLWLQWSLECAGTYLGERHGQHLSFSVVSGLMRPKCRIAADQTDASICGWVFRRS
jgi:hypothetical protein